MRLILDVQAGPATGRSVTVTPDQPFYVGRTETAYLAIPDDRKLGSSHFVLECTKDGCWIRDLNTRWGTFVNGERVIRTALKHGDAITAGESQFLVRLETGVLSAQVNPVSVAVIPPPTPAASHVTPPTTQSPVPQSAVTEFDPRFIREFDARFNHDPAKLTDNTKLLTEAINLGDEVATWPQREAIEAHLDHVLTTRNAQDFLPLTQGARFDWFADVPTTTMLFLISSVVKGRLLAARATPPAD